MTLAVAQKQRVAIARMLLQDTPVLIFDDSLSAVDAETDAAIRDALAGLSIDAVTGSISFDANGDAIKSTAYIKQAIDGGFQFYKVQNAD